MSEWISVKDRLPILKRRHHWEVSDCVLVAHKETSSMMSAPSPWLAFMIKFDGQNAAWKYMGDMPIGEVTHWMPLPPRPDEP